MIRKIPYSDIDFEKYDRCIENSVQKNFYAKKEILDFLCEAWELLVYGDYEFVMAVPIKKKYGLKIVLTPLFCQQLGVFGPAKNSEIEQSFLNYFKNNYQYYLYQFNTENDFKDALVLKKNYVIEKREYALLRKKYYKGRKSCVKSAQLLSCKTLTLNVELINFIEDNFKGLDKLSDLQFFMDYLEFLEDKKYLKLFGAFEEDKLLNLAITIEGDETNYLLGLVNEASTIKKDGASFLIDQLLQNTISQKNFNFMGSSIRGIEVFFKSFGAELSAFPVLQNNKKDLLFSYFRRI